MLAKLHDAIWCHNEFMLHPVLSCNFQALLWFDWLNYLFQNVNSLHDCYISWAFGIKCKAANLIHKIWNTWKLSWFYIFSRNLRIITGVAQKCMAAPDMPIFSIVKSLAPLLQFQFNFLVDKMGCLFINMICICSYHIEAETKWPPFCRLHFQTHFLEWKY